MNWRKYADNDNQQPSTTMGAVDTSSTRPIKLSLNKGLVHTWDPDTGLKTEHKAWKGYLVDLGYESNADHPDERFRNPELLLGIDDGVREAHLAIRLQSTAFRQFACTIENANLRQPLEIRPWYKEKEDGKKFGGINLFQGGKQLAAKHTKETGLPQVVKRMNPVTMKEETDGTEQMAFMRNIIDNWLAVTIREIVEMQAWEEEPKQIGPRPAVPRLGAPAEQLALPAATVAHPHGAPLELAVQNQPADGRALPSDKTGERPFQGEDEEQLPF